MKSLTQSYAINCHQWKEISKISSIDVRLICKLLKTLQNVNRKNNLCLAGPWMGLNANSACPVQGKMLLVIVVAMTKWPEICTMPNCSAEETNSKPSRFFGCYMVMKALVIGSSPKFASHLSNGNAGRFVDTFKIALLEGKDERMMSQVTTEFLQPNWTNYNPVSSDGKSSAEVMFSRSIELIYDTLLASDRVDDHGKSSCIRRFDVRERVFTKSYQGRCQWNLGQLFKQWVDSCITWGEHSKHALDIPTNFMKIKGQWTLGIAKWNYH